ncbi:hypothetical protein ACFL6U_01900 [Planctomycetota bacterium]
MERKKARFHAWWGASSIESISEMAYLRPTRRHCVFVQRNSVAILGLVLLAMMLGGCQQGEKEPSRLEISMEGQALQMAAINDRLSRSEHQWQANAEELLRGNQMAMDDLTYFREEQVRLRETLQDMDERWEEKNNHLGNRQKTLQVSLDELGQTISHNDARYSARSQALDGKLDNQHQILTNEIQTVRKTNAAFSLQVGELQTTTQLIQSDIDSLQDRQGELTETVSQNRIQLLESLAVVVKNQQALDADLVQVQETTEQAAQHLTQVGSKQDRMLGWIGEQEQRLLHATRLVNNHHETLSSQLAHTDQQTADVKGQLAQALTNQQELKKQVEQNFARASHRQEQLLGWSKQQDDQQALRDAIVTGRQETLEDALLSLDGRIQECVNQLSESQGQFSQQTAANLSQLTQQQERLLEQARARQTQLQQIDKTENQHQTVLISRLNVIQDGNTTAQAQLQQIQQRQQNATDQTHGRFDRIDKQQAALLEVNQTNVQQTEALGQALNNQSQQLGNQQEQLQQIHKDTNDHHSVVTAQLSSLQEGDVAVQAGLEQLNQGQKHLSEQLDTRFDNVDEQQEDARTVSQATHKQVDALQETAAHQSRALEVQTEMLGRLHEGVASQVQNVDTKQTQLQDQVTETQAHLLKLEKQHVLELKQQLDTLGKRLIQLEGQFQRASEDLNQLLSAQSDTDQQATQAMKKQLESLEQAILQTTLLQRRFEKQFAELNKTVEVNHQRQTSQMADIKEELSKKKAKKRSK